MSKFWYFLSMKEQGLSWLINMVDLIFDTDVGPNVLIDGPDYG